MLCQLFNALLGGGMIGMQAFDQRLSVVIVEDLADHTGGAVHDRHGIRYAA
jgi:hypothetical protein